MISSPTASTRRSEKQTTRIDEIVHFVWAWRLGALPLACLLTISLFFMFLSFFFQTVPGHATMFGFEPKKMEYEVCDISGGQITAMTADGQVSGRRRDGAAQLEKGTSVAL